MKNFLLTMGLFLSIFCDTGFAQDTFVVGIPPYANSENFEEAFQPFTDYLSKATGFPSEFVLFKSYEEFADAFVSGKISLGFFGATLYVQTKDKHPGKVHYLATCQKIAKYKGKKVRTHYYYSYFVVNANSPYKSLKDLKGKKWGFVKKSSSSGYQYPMSHFVRKEIDPSKYFSEVKFLGKHPKVTDALSEWKPGADNVIDAGASSDKNLWLAEKKYGNIFRKIAKVGPIPLHALAVSQEVAQNKVLRDKIINALTNVPEEVVSVENFPYSGWKIISDSDYDIVRRVVGIEK